MNFLVQAGQNIGFFFFMNPISQCLAGLKFMLDHYVIRTGKIGINIILHIRYTLKGLGFPDINCV